MLIPVLENNKVKEVSSFKNFFNSTSKNSWISTTKTW